MQGRPRPQIGPILADVAAGIGNGQRMREVEPADIVGDRVGGRPLEGGVEMQQIEAGSSDQRIVELATCPIIPASQSSPSRALPAS